MIVFFLEEDKSLQITNICQSVCVTSACPLETLPLVISKFVGAFFTSSLFGSPCLILAPVQRFM